MSGIAALLQFDGSPAAPGRIAAMTARMAHRGPDGIAHWQEGPAALGHCMFHTTAESMLAAQPLADDSGKVLVVLDGRIDNHEDLARLLTGRGARLRSKADAELVLQAYLMFGEDLAPQLEGAFAIAIWDGRARKAVCLRDIFGYKPFHYHWDGRRLSIASEVAPLLDLPWVPERIDEATVAEFLEADWQSTEATFWQDLRKLPIAHLMVCDARGPRVRPYWQPDPHAPCPVRDEREAAEHYRALLTEAVRRSSRSHLPIACEVSGGLDSSAIFSLAVQLQRAGRLGAPGLSGYTLRADGYPEMNDLPYARSLARFLDTPIREMPFTRIAIEEHVDRARRRRNFPGFPHFYSSLGIMRDARDRGGAVLLAGEGGDEWTSLPNLGIDYADRVAARDWRDLRASLAADLADFGPLATLRMVLRFGLGSNLPAWMRRGRRAARARLDALRGHRGHWVSPRLAALLAARRQPRATMARVSQISLNGHLHWPYRVWSLENMDYETSEMQFERRNPFDSRAIVELAFSLPAWMFRRGAMQKRFHRLAMADLLPREILERRDKAWFLSPMKPQTREVLGRLAEARTGLRRDWIRPETLAEATRSDLSDWQTLPDEIEKGWALFSADLVD